jgi:hypothetical protein
MRMGNEGGVMNGCWMETGRWDGRRDKDGWKTGKWNECDMVKV